MRLTSKEVNVQPVNGRLDVVARGRGQTVFTTACWRPNDEYLELQLLMRAEAKDPGWPSRLPSPMETPVETTSLITVVFGYSAPHAVNRLLRKLGHLDETVRDRADRRLIDRVVAELTRRELGP